MSGFNADKRAQEREEGPVTIGGVTYHPRRLTNKRLKHVRQLARQVAREAREAAKASEEYREEYELARGEGKDEAEAERRALNAGMSADTVDDINQRSLAAQLPQLLVDDNQQPVTSEQVLEHLDEDLDARDVGDLMTYLLGTPDEDPTPA